MLAVGNKYPKVNLQFENPSGLLDILKLVKEKTPDGEQQAGMTPEKVEKLKEASFQVRQALQQFPVYVGTITFCDISAI